MSTLIGKCPRGFLKGTREEVIVCPEEMELGLPAEAAQELEEAQGQEEEWEGGEPEVEAQGL